MSIVSPSDVVVCKVKPVTTYCEGGALKPCISTDIYLPAATGPASLNYMISKSVVSPDANLQVVSGETSPRDGAHSTKPGDTDTASIGT